MREADAKKRTLEDIADTLRDECAKLKAANQVILLMCFNGEGILINLFVANRFRLPERRNKPLEKYAPLWNSKLKNCEACIMHNWPLSEMSSMQPMHSQVILKS